MIRRRCLLHCTHNLINSNNKARRTLLPTVLHFHCHLNPQRVDPEEEEEARDPYQQHQHQPQPQLPQQYNHKKHQRGNMSIFHQDHSEYDERSVELCNGQLINTKSQQPPHHEDSVMFLKNRPRGPYTTMRTLLKRTHIFQFDNHVQRLIDSSRVMMKQEKETCDGEQFNTMHSMTDVARAGQSYSMDALSNSQQLSAILKHVVRESIVAYERQFPSDHPDQELKITVLICWNMKSNQFDVFSHVVDLMERPDRPVLVDVRSGTRKDMKAKDSFWMEMREAFLNKKTKKSNEVLMCESDGSVREGLSSNFFVVKDHFIVQTANEGILDGTVKQLIDKIALEPDLVQYDNESLKMDYSVPTLQELSQWREAFITSTSRQILPIYGFVIAQDCIQYVEENAAKKMQPLDNGDYYYPLLPPQNIIVSPRAQALQNVLSRKLAEMSVRIIP